MGGVSRQDPRHRLTPLARECRRTRGLGFASASALAGQASVWPPRHRARVHGLRHEHHRQAGQDARSHGHQGGLRREGRAARSGQANTALPGGSRRTRRVARLSPLKRPIGHPGWPRGRLLAPQAWHAPASTMGSPYRRPKPGSGPLTRKTLQLPIWKLKRLTVEVDADAKNSNRREHPRRGRHRRRRGAAGLPEDRRQREAPSGAGDERPSDRPRTGSQRQDDR